MRTRTYYLAAAAVVALNIVVAAQHVSHAPFVDGWAVWNRVMLLDLGQMSLRSYLLGFFGAHPHSVILLLSLLDHRLVDADQTLLAVVDYAAVAAFALFCVHRFLAWTKRAGARGAGVLLGVVAIAALTTTLADSQVMALPFQGVLSISRLAYVVLLWQLIRALRDGSTPRLWAVTILSCLAVTFHGTGPLFALVFLLVHLLLHASSGRLFGAAAPLAVVVLHAWLYKRAGELDQIGALVSVRAVVDTAKALLAYFATPMAPLRALVRDAALLPFGLVVLGCTTWLTTRILLDAARRRWGRAPSAPISDERLFAGVLGLLLLLSGAAAAVLTTIRYGADSYHAVLASPRYVAYALIAYVLVVCVLVRSTHRPDRRDRRSALAAVTVLGALGLYPAVVFSDYDRTDIDLARAVAAISAGMSPLDPPANAIWPPAKDDWYWVDALPATTRYLMKERAGPWSRLPVLGQLYVGRARAAEIDIVGVAGCSPACPATVRHFTGTTSARTDGAFRRSQTVAILDDAGEVVGFAARVRTLAGSRRRELFGYVVAESATLPGRLFVGPADGRYEAAAAGAGLPAAAAPLRPPRLTPPAFPASSAASAAADTPSAAR